jgi:hypothetical protein
MRSLATRRTRAAALGVLVALLAGIDANASQIAGLPDTLKCSLAMSRRLGILLPDGATLLLRREYRAFYRSLVISREGFELDKAYLASQSEGVAPGAPA